VVGGDYPNPPGIYYEDFSWACDGNAAPTFYFDEGGLEGLDGLETINDTQTDSIIDLMARTWIDSGAFITLDIEEASNPGGVYPGAHNGYDEIIADVAGHGPIQGALALTTCSQVSDSNGNPTAQNAECDITIYGYYRTASGSPYVQIPWTLDTTDPNRVPIQSILAHEMGHVLGLRDNASVGYSGLMFYQGGPLLKPFASTDEQAAIVYLYGE